MKKKQKRFDTPVLFIIFNRPNTTEKVFETIRKIKPTKLFIAADGPRIGKRFENEICKKTRTITEKIDWECEVKRLYRPSNLGCGVAVSGAIDWFFKHVDSGIILEDDCLANDDFFRFASQMLKENKDNNKIMHISGDNFMDSQKQRNDVYFLSKYVHVWGWATWKRAWNKYDYDMKDWGKKNLIVKYNTIDGDLWDKLFWLSKFDGVAYKIINTWDYQWIYSVMKDNGSALVPGTNLVSNIGFGTNSTHTNNSNYFMSNNKTFNLKEKIALGNNKMNNLLNRYEEDVVFKTRSLNTLLHFAYFSIFGLIYNRLTKSN